MITAIKKRESLASRPESWKEVEELKAAYGLEYHHLQRILTESF